MPEEGLCPSCGHLVISGDSPAKPSAIPAKRDEIATTGAGGLARGRDYSAALLGMFFYLAFFALTIMLMMAATIPYNVVVAVGISAALSVAVTRLLCRVEAPETSGSSQRPTWIIRNETLRRMMANLNALWFG